LPFNGLHGVIFLKIVLIITTSVELQILHHQQRLLGNAVMTRQSPGTSMKGSLYGVQNI
jgi:hypothetical protein